MATDAYRPAWDCAAAGCAESCATSWLERISPSPGPFVGVCPTHGAASIIFALKPEAAALLDGTDG